MYARAIGASRKHFRITHQAGNLFFAFFITDDDFHDVFYKIRPGIFPGHFEFIRITGLSMAHAMRSAWNAHRFVWRPVFSMSLLIAIAVYTIKTINVGHSSFSASDLD
jgi:hypothetical protein